MFVTPAYAQAAGGAGGFGGLGGLESLLPLVLIFVVFYFLLIRPQQKKQKQHREMLAAVRRGDRVVTAGGIIGQVVRVVNDSELIIEIADGVRVRLVRAMVSDVLAKTEPKGDETDEEEDEGGAKASPSETKKS
jgi:preprotein translocase subunit YajC